MGAVRVGVGLSPDVLKLDRSRLAELVDRINASPIDHVVVTDHVAFRGGRGHDGLAALHFLAGLGVERELHTGVLLLPLRHPTLVARQLLDLADIHRAGVVAGVGVGGDDAAEYSMVGLESGQRGDRMDDAVALLLELLADQQPIVHEGYYPTNGPGLARGDGRAVKVLVGGRVDASHQRAALADGWLAAFCSVDRFGAGVQRMNGLARNPINGYQAWFGVGSSGREHADRQIRRFYGVDPANFERYVPVGDNGKLIEHFEPYVDAGANVLNLFPAGDPEMGVDAVALVAEAMHIRS